jgi:FAD/FMN-containing dehydrogenase
LSKSPFFNKILKRLSLLALVVLAFTLLVTVWSVVRAPIDHRTPQLLIDDVSQLNPTPVRMVITPKTTQEIIEAVKQHNGPIAIGGARHSMGGQIATEGALYIDMRQFDKILTFSPREKTITVQAGTRWRQIQQRIDPSNLSVTIMQSYANFTVGGSLSVNVHGRYVGLGPIILSVKSLKVVLADGSLIEASSTQNADIFNGVIGGYGGLGVITEATFALTDNVKVKRHDEMMPITKYKQYFFNQVRGSPTAVFHNANIYPNSYDKVRAVTYTKTDDRVTVADRLIAENKSYRSERFAYWVVSEWPFGKAIRQHVIDPILFRSQPVTWRNYEASYDAAELEPASRRTSTYVLEEYFVPVNRFDEFVPRLREVLQRHYVNVINVSVRHTNQDPGSLLAWAREEVFAFVIYYKQGKSAAAQKEVRDWTRELIDAALNLGGSYYLPYQVHATEEQFLTAYPRAPEWFALKQRLDPTNKFRNAFWNNYYHPYSRDQ